MAIVNATARIDGRGNQVNLIRNPLMLGGITGSPGTLPTNWSVVPPTGVTRTTSTYGVDATTGLAYVEFRFTGTPTAATGNIRWDTSLGIFCNPSDIFSQSIYAAITGGDLTNVVNFSLGLYTTDAAGTIVTSPGTANVIAVNDVMQRFVLPAFALAATSTIRHVWPVLQFTFTVGQPVDFTLRLSAPQVEFAGKVTDVSMPAAGTFGPSDRVLTPAMAYVLAGRARLDGRGGQVNLVRNPRGEGVIPGTPGTPPTYWSSTLIGGLSRQIVGAGTDGATGLPYTDWRYFGTASGTSNNIRLDSAVGIAANAGDTFSASVYAALVAGSDSGGQVTFQLGLWINDFDGNGISGPVPWVPVTLTGTLQRFFDPADTITVNPATAFVWPVFQFNYPNGTIVDFTLRLAGAQVEYGASVTDLRLPPAGTLAPSDRVITPDGAVVSVIIGGRGGMTNWIDNPNAEGAVVGTPGTLPTNWSWSNTLGLATQIVARGAADPDFGLPYTDIRLFGTPTTTGGVYLRLATTTSIAGLSGDGWSQSVHAALVGGSTVNLLSVGQVVLYLTTTGAIVTNTGSTPFTPTATLQRFSINNRVTPVGATIRRVCPVLWFQVTIGNAIDLTLRIVAPQFESNPVVTPLILPPLGSPGVTTRALLAQPTTLVTAQARINGVGGFTNWMTNPNGVGASVGVPGSLPTNWSAGNTATGFTVLGTGTVVTDDDGQLLNYVDIRFNATVTTGQNTLRFEDTTTIPTQPAAVWSMSLYVALVGGSLANVTSFGQVLYATSETGANIGNAPQVLFTPTASLQRILAQNRVLPVGVSDIRHAWPVILISYTQGAPVDFTLRFAGIQLEAGPVCNPVVVPRAANLGPVTRALLAMPTVANFAEIDGVGTLRATAVKTTTAQVRIGGLGSVRATAVVRAHGQAEIDGEGNVGATGGGLQFARAIINGGEANWFNPRQRPQQQPGNTSVISTDVPPPFGDNALVFMHAKGVGSADTNCGALLTQAGAPLIPYNATVWVWVPSGYAGAQIGWDVEGGSAGIPGTTAFAELGLTDQWQFLTCPTKDPTGAFNGVIRSYDTTASTFYTALWCAVPDTMVAEPQQTMRGTAEIDGEGFVIPAPLGRVPTSAQINGVGDFDAIVVARRAAAAQIGGVGSLRVNGTPLRPAFAEIDGEGFVAATPAAFATQAQARINGVGDFDADARPMRDADARIAGVGGVSAVARVLLAALAEIDGEGFVVPGRGCARSVSPRSTAKGLSSRASVVRCPPRRGSLALAHSAPMPGRCERRSPRSRAAPPIGCRTACRCRVPGIPLSSRPMCRHRSRAPRSIATTSRRCQRTTLAAC